jgi:ABC-type lipoprotein export system ATPase subunit
MTVLVVTNDEAASQQADRGVRFRDGKIVGAAENLARSA